MKRGKQGKQKESSLRVRFIPTYASCETAPKSESTHLHIYFQQEQDRTYVMSECASEKIFFLEKKITPQTYTLV